MKQIILQSPVNWGVISVSLLLCIQTILEKRSNQLTAIAGQPFEGTVAGSPLSYGFIDTVSTTNEYTNVTALTLGEHEASVEVGESVQLSATMSIVPMQKYPAGIYFVRMENRVVKVVKR